MTDLDLLEKAVADANVASFSPDIEVGYSGYLVTAIDESGLFGKLTSALSVADGRARSDAR